jgi:hypothetical protein
VKDEERRVREERRFVKRGFKREGFVKRGFPLSLDLSRSFLDRKRDT